MNQQFFTSKQKPVLLQVTPKGIGGEGNVYSVVVDDNEVPLVAKIYHTKELEREATNQQQGKPTREAKIRHLIRFQTQLSPNCSAIFPEETLYNAQGDFVGFLMREAPGDTDLSSLCSLKLFAGLPSQWHQKYDRYEGAGVADFAQLCQKIAQVFAQIHQTEELVLVDVKPENIHVSFQGEVSLIDIDSVQVVNKNEVLFPANKLTPEYCPPEYQDLHFKQDFIPQTWDRFALGVIFYKLLLGLHPYTGSCYPPYDELTTNAQKIAEGLFPHGAQKEYFSIIPHPHQSFNKMPEELRALFYRCFEEGHQKPDARPQATEWEQAFGQVAHHEYAGMVRVAPQVLTKVEPNNATTPVQAVKESRVALWGFFSAAVMLLFFLSIIFKNIAGEAPVYAADYEYYKQYFPGDYQVAHPIVEGRRLVLNYGKYGFLNSKNEVVIPLQYDYADDFKEGVACVAKNGKYGFIDEQGKVVIPLQYDGAAFFFNGKAQIEIITPKGRKYLLIDRDGKPVTHKYDYIGDFYYGRAVVRTGDLIGFIDENGHEIISLKYIYAHNFDETGVALVGDKLKKHYINKAGGHVRNYIPPKH
ncbi:WG repeat-containing protein [Microscilla marina]|uniref:Protein kinase domain n=1 Tax=Microscilla marina ATCC 23134 TaxID=313606 RepID=A1ZP77_MICM2|nr:WG repeat-containing protein [Microscilla marina]EAY27869.1 protein kinase domain [Microscilla marina ATCC 23134]